MIINSNDNYVQSSLDDKSVTQFSIQTDAAMFTVFRKSIYSDTKLAAIRELSTNAVDSCIDSNVPVNFEVHIPTLEESYFSVRDYGNGIPIDFLRGDFTVVGASTKRNSNKTNGSFGMGRLSPLAYASSFTVESWFEGTHYSYLVSIQEGIPVAIELSTNPSTEPSGAKFAFPVEPSDIAQFREKAAHLLKYFSHKPTINVELPEVNVHLDSDNFMLTDDKSGVLMANVYYPLDTRHVSTNYNGLILKVPTGKVSLTPGREALNYDAATIQYLQDYVVEAEDELIALSNTTILSEPSIYLQAKKYHFIRGNTPWRRIDELTIPTSTIGSFDINNTCPISSPYMSAVFRTPQYKNLRSPYMSWVNSDWFYKAEYFIADQRNYMDALNTLDSRSVVVFKPESLTNDGFETQIPQIIELLKQFGITDYTLASECDVSDTVREKKTRVSNPDISMREIDRYMRSPQNYQPSDGTVYYVPLNGSNLTRNISPDSLYTLAKHLGYDTIYGVPKTSIAKARAHPNFINFYDHLKSTLGTSSILMFNAPDAHNSLFDRFSSDILARLLKNPKTPSDILVGINEYNALKNTSYRTLSSTDIQELADIFHIQVVPVTLRTNYDVLIKKYPLLNAIRYERPAVVDHYINLEHAYANSLHPPQ